MSRLPREPLDADERALAARLPRLHGRDHPDDALDARILAAAQAALAPNRAIKRRRGWMVPLSAAASLSLAAGLAWQLQPPPAPQATPALSSAPQSTSSATHDDPQRDLRALESVPASPAAAVQSSPQPVAAPPARAAHSQDNARIAREAAPTEPVAAAPEFVPSPPPAVAATADAVPAPTMVPPPAPPAPPATPSPAPASAQAAVARDNTIVVTGTALKTQARHSRQASEAEAADAQTLDALADSIQQDEDDIPPATMDAPAARDAWLRRIVELLEQERIEDAKASLAEFRRRYPDAELPAKLRKLEL